MSKFLPKICLSIFIIFQTIPLNAQEIVPFFRSDPNLEDPDRRRELYKNAKGSYLQGTINSKRNDNPNSLANNYSPDYAYVASILALHNQFIRNTGRHYIFLDLLEDQYKEIAFFIDQFATEINTYEQYKISEICNRSQASNGGNISTLYDDYIDAKKTVNADQVASINNFKSNIRQQMGEDVLDQVNLYVDKFSNSSSYSRTVGIISGLGVDMSEAEYLSGVCE